MKILKLSIFSFFIFISTSFHPKEYFEEFDIEEIYKGVIPNSGTMVLSLDEELVEPEIILYRTGIDIGKYSVNITRKADDLYKIDGKNIYIKTRYCYEYSYSAESILIIESSYGYSKGKIIIRE